MLEKNLWLYTASIKSTVGNKFRLFTSPFHIPTTPHFLAGTFRSEYIAAYSTVLCSATEETESVAM